MKKICFICFGNLYLTPYLKNYTEVIPHTYDLIIWNRHGINETKEHTVFSYNYCVDDNLSGRIKKLKGYIGFSGFIVKKLINKEYDIIICLQSVGAICIAPILLTKYKRKYVIDVRDYSIEGNPLLKFIEGILMDFSKLNVISSEGFKTFLPKGKHYCLVHNYSAISSDIVDGFARKKIKIPIRLSYIGMIRFQEQNKKIIDLFANDDRFQLQFIGKNALELRPYISSKNIKNVHLIDQFPPENTIDYYRNTDAILNVYGNHSPLLDYALSNKLYYAAALKLPILVSKHTYMERIAVGGGFGFTIDFDNKQIKDELFLFMTQRDTDKFAENCDIFMERVKKENLKFSTIIKNILV